MKTLIILFLVVLQLPTCNDEEKKPISENAKITFRLAENEMTEGYEERELNEMKVYLSPKTDITEKDIDFVIKSHDKHTGMPIINLEMNTMGADKFAALTANNVSKMLAILVNNKIIIAPVIQQKITGGKVQITGGFTNEKVDSLFKALTE